MLLLDVPTKRSSRMRIPRSRRVEFIQSVKAAFWTSVQSAESLCRRFVALERICSENSEPPTTDPLSDVTPVDLSGEMDEVGYRIRMNGCYLAVFQFNHLAAAWRIAVARMSFSSDTSLLTLILSWMFLRVRRRGRESPGARTLKLWEYCKANVETNRLALNFVYHISPGVLSAGCLGKK